VLLLLLQLWSCWDHDISVTVHLPACSLTVLLWYVMLFTTCLQSEFAAGVAELAKVKLEKPKRLYSTNMPLLAVCCAYRAV
jgi:hypothetical protein